MEWKLYSDMCVCVCKEDARDVNKRMWSPSSFSSVFVGELMSLKLIIPLLGDL